VTGQLQTAFSRKWLPESGPLRLLLEVLIIVPAYALYQLVRGLVDSTFAGADAFSRAQTLIHIETRLGIFWEAELQALILTKEALVNLFNLIYVWGHLPFIIVVAVLLYFLRRDRYPMYRNAFLISGAIGLIAFAFVPLAPPRFMPAWGFVDTAVREGSYYIWQNPAFVNQYAAMPSLHFGWDLLVACVIFREAPGPLRWLGLVTPVLTLVAIVVTANHYFLDAAAGGAVAVAGLALAYLIHRRIPRQSPLAVLT
jgi:hypothetical protein